MNTVAKNKVEKIVNHEIEQRIAAYKKRRADALNALIEHYEKTPSNEARIIQGKLKQNEEEKERLEAELAAVGYETNYRGELKLRSHTHWDDNYRTSWKEYFVSELTAHSKDTAEMVRKLELLGRQYALKIWAGEASAELDLLGAFEQELSKLNVESPA
jgi:hypothetical protein